MMDANTIANHLWDHLDESSRLAMERRYGIDGKRFLANMGAFKARLVNDGGNHSLALDHNDGKSGYLFKIIQNGKGFEASLIKGPF